MRFSTYLSRPTDTTRLPQWSSHRLHLARIRRKINTETTPRSQRSPSWKCSYTSTATAEVLVKFDEGSPFIARLIVLISVSSSYFPFYIILGLTLSFTIPTFNTSGKEAAFENIVGKGENAGNQHFLLFPRCFLLFPS